MLQRNILFVLISTFVASASCSRVDHKRSIQKFIFSGYNKKLPPPTGVSTPLNVGLAISLDEIEDLDQRLERLTVFAYLYLNWQDKRLLWNPAAHGNVDRLVMSAGSVWLPELVLKNTMNEGKDLNHASKFPYDKQTCKIELAGWTTMNSVKLNVDTTLYYEGEVVNGQWDLQKNSTNITVNNNFTALDMDPNGQQKIPLITVQLRLTRNGSFYWYSIVIPACIVTCLAFLVFFIPPESPVKLALGITVVLSYITLLISITKILPEKTASLPVLAIYVMVNLMWTALALAVASVVVALNNIPPRRPVPEWLKRIVFKNTFSLRRLACLDYSHAEEAERQDMKKKKHQTDKSDINEIKTAMMKNGPNNSTSLFGSAAMDAELKLTLTMVKNFINTQEGKRGKKSVTDVNKTQWNDTARILDRFFGYIFIIVVVATTFICYYVINEFEDFKKLESTINK